MAADEAPEPLIPRRWRDIVGPFGSLVTAALTGRHNSSLGAAHPLFHEVDGNLFEVGGLLRALTFRHLSGRYQTVRDTGELVVFSFMSVPTG